MLWKSQRRTNYGRLFELKLGTHLFFWDPDILVAFRGDPPFLVAPNFYFEARVQKQFRKFLIPESLV